MNLLTGGLLVRVQPEEPLSLRESDRFAFGSAFSARVQPEEPILFENS
jgi:hypothetical protein